MTRPAAWLYRHSETGRMLAGRERIDQPRLVDVLRVRFASSQHDLRPLAETRPYWWGEVLRARAERAIDTKPWVAVTPDQSVGRVIGQCLAAFALHIVGEARRLELDEVCFVSRDAWLMLRLYRFARRTLGQSDVIPRGRYLVVSRAAVNKAQENESDTDRLGTYLERCGLFDRSHVGLVDIGWHGTTQDSLARLLAKNNSSAALHGLYLAFAVDHDRAPDPCSPDRQGFLADSRRGDWLECFVFRHCSVLEELTQAPHRSVVGYADCGRPILGGVRPSLGFARAMQREALQAGQSHIIAACDLGVSARDLRAGCLERLRRLLHHPTLAEAQAISSLTHDNPVPEPVPYDGIGGIADPAWPLAEQLQRNYWPSGMIRLSRGSLACLSHEIKLANRAGKGEWV